MTQKRFSLFYSSSSFYAPTIFTGGGGGGGGHLALPLSVPPVCTSQSLGKMVSMGDLSEVYNGPWWRHLCHIGTFLVLNSFPAIGNFCHLLMIFANSLDPDQAQHFVRKNPFH